MRRSPARVSRAPSRRSHSRNREFWRREKDAAPAARWQNANDVLPLARDRLRVRNHVGGHAFLGEVEDVETGAVTLADDVAAGHVYTEHVLVEGDLGRRDHRRAV